jgi:hypothetical protein
MKADWGYLALPEADSVNLICITPDTVPSTNAQTSNVRVSSSKLSPDLAGGLLLRQYRSTELLRQVWW